MQPGHPREGPSWGHRGALSPEVRGALSNLGGDISLHRREGAGGGQRPPGDHQPLPCSRGVLRDGPGWALGVPVGGDGHPLPAFDRGTRDVARPPRCPRAVGESRHLGAPQHIPEADCPRKAPEPPRKTKPGVLSPQFASLTLLQDRLSHLCTFLTHFALLLLLTPPAPPRIRLQPPPGAAPARGGCPHISQGHRRSSPPPPSTSHGHHEPREKIPSTQHLSMGHQGATLAHVS